MKDYVREMMEAWSTQGEQAAYDLNTELLKEIEADFDRLKNQMSAINALRAYLQDSGNLEASTPVTNPDFDTVEPSERPRLIVNAAQVVWRQQPDNLVKVQWVLDELNTRGLDLGVRQPLAVIGTVLASADGFTKIARNTFEYDADLPF